jgi:hypothetical protein
MLLCRGCGLTVAGLPFAGPDKAGGRPWSCRYLHVQPQFHMFISKPHPRGPFRRRSCNLDQSFPGALNVELEFMVARMFVEAGFPFAVQSWLLDAQGDQVSSAFFM